MAAIVDLRERRLPNTLTLAGVMIAALTVLAVTAAEGAEAGGDVLLSVAGGAALLAGPLLVVHLVSPQGMGFGDVKAALALGAAVGLIDAWSALVALFIGSLLSGSAGLLTRRRHVPFGPGLVVGTALALVVARVRAVPLAG